MITSSHLQVFISFTKSKTDAAIAYVPIAFIHSWFPKCDNTTPPVVAACRRNCSIQSKRAIVSSPLTLPTHVSSLSSIASDSLEMSSPIYDIPSLDEKICVASPIAELISDARKLENTSCIFHVPMEVADGYDMANK